MKMMISQGCNWWVLCEPGATQCGIYTLHVLQIKEVPNWAKEEHLDQAVKQSLTRIINFSADQCLTFASANSGDHSSQPSKFTQKLDKAGVKGALNSFSPTFQSMKTTRRRKAKHEAEIGHVEETPKVVRKSVRNAKNRRQNWARTTPSLKQSSTSRSSASSLPSQHSSSVVDPTHTEVLGGSVRWHIRRQHAPGSFPMSFCRCSEGRTRWLWKSSRCGAIQKHM